MANKPLEKTNRELVLVGSKARLAPLPIFFFLILFILLGSYLSLRLGAKNYSLEELLSVLENPFQSSSLQDIIFDLRFPRLLTAGLVGASLAVSGAVMQAITRNPLADPSLLGIPAGAGLFLLLKMILLPDTSSLLSLLACMIGAGLVAGLVILFGQSRGNKNTLRLILSGLMITALVQALGQALALVYQLSTHILGLQAGSLTTSNWQQLGWFSLPILFGLIFVQIFAHSLTILSLDKNLATSLGQHTQRMTLIFLLLVVLLSASSVALVGSLSFVGLIIPNLLLGFMQKDYRFLLPLSGLAGAGFLIWVDLFSRILTPPYEIPLSSIIPLIGFPIFIWLVRKGGTNG
ncbi:TPA: FecCD family ABC transporter permease [Streptococcus suis]